MKVTIHILVSSLLIAIILSCQKQIEFDLPEVEQTIVVEGKIESGEPPIVYLTNTQGYFDSLDINTLLDIFIKDAIVKVSDGINEVTLLHTFNIAQPEKLWHYTCDSASFHGVDGRNYLLTIEYGGEIFTANTQIPYPVPLDSIWFEAQSGLDSLGFIWTKFTDPDTLGNCYRWFSQRINTYLYNYPSPYDNIKGQKKDTIMVAPFGSATDDKLFNGLAFEFAVARGEIGNFEGPDDEGPEEGMFKIGDTVAIKATSITYSTYLFVRSMEDQALSNGSPFASPGNLPNNIIGGAIGNWSGYGVYRDTVICM